MKNESDVQGVSILGEFLFLTYLLSVLLAMNNEVVTILIISYRISYKDLGRQSVQSIMLLIVIDILTKKNMTITSMTPSDVLTI